ncbi:hypothetical protein [Streptomyces goshikiensis]|uniref:hypothetical protein n=1 Tax=Streptomyces goshikiensis TaxID=1942 RepID=UPI00339E7CA1
MPAEEDDFSSRLIKAWPMLADAFSPERLAQDEETIHPGLAALSILSSRKEFWRPHCLLVGFATASTSEPTYKEGILAKLREHSLEKWPYDRQFLEYLEQHPFAPPQKKLRFTLLLIAQALTPEAVAAAQWETLKIYACLDECDHDLDCFSECMKRP